MKWNKWKIGILLHIGMPIFLTGCEFEVHWFDRHAHVPWYVIVVPCVVIFAIAHICFIRHTYRCPKCEHTFRPRWYETSSWIHDGNRRVVKCPKCGRRGFCSIEPK